MADTSSPAGATPAPAPVALQPESKPSSSGSQASPGPERKNPDPPKEETNHVQYSIVVPWRHVAGPAELEQIAGELKRGNSAKNDEDNHSGPTSPVRGRPAPPAVTSPRMAHANGDGTSGGSVENSTATSPIRERTASPALVRGDSKENVKAATSSGEGSPRSKARDAKSMNTPERSLSLKNMANSVKSFFKPEDRDKIVIDRPEHPQEDNKKPFPGVRLHVIATAPPELQPAFPGLPMHLSSDMAKKIETGDKPPKPAFPGLPLHVIDELGQRKTYVGKDLREWTVPSSPRKIPPELFRGRQGSPRNQELVGKACVVVPRCGKIALQGLRPNMEDFYSAFDDLKEHMPALPWEARFAYYGVYDGHAGPQCAEILKEALYRNILEHAAFASGKVPEALHHGFLRTDAQVLEVATREQWRTGSTAVVAVIVNNVLWVANVGDSELVLARRRPKQNKPERDSTPSKRDLPAGPSSSSSTGVASAVAISTPTSSAALSSSPAPVPALLSNSDSAMASTPPPRDIVSSPLRARDSAGEEPAVDAQVLTAKHKPTVLEEKARIEAAGGKVVFGRLFAELAVSRAFGDRDFKRPVSENDFLSVEPHLIEVRLQPGLDEFFILASDGLWDKVTYQQAAELVRDQRIRGRSPDEIAAFLANTALQLRSKDNVTVLVVFLEWRLEEQDRKDREARFGVATATAGSAVAAVPSASSEPSAASTAQAKEKEPIAPSTPAPAPAVSAPSTPAPAASSSTPAPAATSAGTSPSGSVTAAVSPSAPLLSSSSGLGAPAAFDLNALVAALKVKYKDLTISSDDADDAAAGKDDGGGADAPKGANPKMLMRASPDPRKGGGGVPASNKRAMLQKTGGKEGHGVAYTAGSSAPAENRSPPGTINQVPTGLNELAQSPAPAAVAATSVALTTTPAPAATTAASTPVPAVAVAPTAVPTPVAVEQASTVSSSSGAVAASPPVLSAASPSLDSPLGASPFAAPAAGTPSLSVTLSPVANGTGSTLTRPMSTTVDWTVSVQKTVQAIQEEERAAASGSAAAASSSTTQQSST